MGKELQKYIICDAPSHKDIDITKIFIKKKAKTEKAIKRRVNLQY